MTTWVVTRTYDVHPPMELMDRWEDELVEVDAIVARVPGAGIDVTVHVDAASATEAITGSESVVSTVEGDVIAVRAVTQVEHDRAAEAFAVPELMSATEVADELGVTRQRVHQLRANPAFPAPLADLRGGAIWEADAIRTFNRQWQRKPGRPAKTSDPASAAVG